MKKGILYWILIINMSASVGMFFLWGLYHFKQIEIERSYIIKETFYLKKIYQYKARIKSLEYEQIRLLKRYFYIYITLSAYTTAKDETNNDNGNTAIMEKPIPGKTVAVSQDLSYLLGKWIYIEGIGVRFVNDLMNKRWTKKVDVLAPTKEHARNFGIKKNVKIVVLIGKTGKEN